MMTSPAVSLRAAHASLASPEDHFSIRGNGLTESRFSKKERLALGRNEKHARDWGTVGTTYFLRHGVRCVRQGRWIAGAAAFTCASVTALPAAAISPVMGTIILGELGEGLRFGPPTLAALRKDDAVRAIRTAREAWRADMLEMAETLRESGTCDATVVRSKAQQTERELEPFLEALLNADPRIQSSRSLDRELKLLKAGLTAPFVELCVASFKKTVDMLPVAHRLGGHHLDVALKQWTHVCEWFQTLNANERPADAQIRAWTSFVQKRAGKLK